MLINGLCSVLSLFMFGMGVSGLTFFISQTNGASSDNIRGWIIFGIAMIGGLYGLMRFIIAAVKRDAKILDVINRWDKTDRPGIEKHISEHRDQLSRIEKSLFEMTTRLGVVEKTSETVAGMILKDDTRPG